MSVRFAYRFAKFTAAAVLTVVTVACPRMVAAQSEEAAGGLTGTWRVQVTLENCSTHQTMGVAFSSLLTFGRGGTLTGTTRNAAFEPGQRTGDFGVWRHTEGNTYVADSEAFLLFTSSAPPVFQAGTQRIIQSITLGSDSFESVAVVRFYDTAGNVVSSGCAHAIGTRYE